MMATTLPLKRLLLHISQSEQKIESTVAKSLEKFYTEALQLTVNHALIHY